MQRLCAIVLCLLAGTPAASAQDAATLRARYAELREDLSRNVFQRPLHLQSHQTGDSIQGDIHAVIEQPFPAVAPALQGMNHWCDMLILHLNVKSCSGSSTAAGDVLGLNVGRKFDQPLDETYRYEFAYRIAELDPGYLRIELRAPQGSLGTRDYRITLETALLDARRSFLRLSYSYSYGMTARIALQGYLKTIGRDKRGFTIVGRNADDRPIHIGGMRGVIERNTMRYFLAVEAYLGALQVPETEQVAKRLRDWYDGTERYAAQLHEIGRDDYLRMKQNEIQRQQSPGVREK